jgi:hypothetical protein
LDHSERHRHRRRYRTRTPPPPDRIHHTHLYSQSGDLLLFILSDRLFAIREPSVHVIGLESTSGWSNRLALSDQGTTGGDEEIGQTDEEGGESVGPQGLVGGAVWSSGAVTGLRAFAHGTTMFTARSSRDHQIDQVFTPCIRLLVAVGLPRVSLTFNR